MPSEGDFDPPGDSLAPGDESAPLPHAVIALRHRRLGIPAFFAGPLLPSPEDLVGYKAAAREAPIALLADYFAEGEHRRQLETEIVREELLRARRAQVFALVIMVAGLLLGVALVLAGHDWAGAALVGGNLVAMGAVFLRATREDEAARRPREPVRRGRRNV